jgi:hypothetical protein
MSILDTTIVNVAVKSLPQIDGASSATIVTVN